MDSFSLLVVNLHIQILKNEAVSRKETENQIIYKLTVRCTEACQVFLTK